MIISITVYLAPHHRWGDGDRPVNTIVGTVWDGYGRISLDTTSQVFT